MFQEVWEGTLPGDTTPDDTRRRVLVCGATGYLGRHLVRTARRRGHWVRALVRNPEGLGNARGDELLQMARSNGTVWVPGTGEVRFNPVHGEDLAEVCLDAVEDPTARGRHIPVGGPDVLSGREIAELAFEALGKPARIRRLPNWAMKAASSVIRPFNVNVASLLAMFTVFSEDDAVTDAYGTHHLRDFYAELVANAGDGPLAVR